MQPFNALQVLREAGDRIPILNIHHDRIDCEDSICVMVQPHAFRVRRGAQFATATSVDHLVAVVNAIHNQHSRSIA